jgi:hypothetical protein
LRNLDALRVAPDLPSGIEPRNPLRLRSCLTPSSTWVKNPERRIVGRPRAPQGEAHAEQKWQIFLEASRKNTTDAEVCQRWGIAPHQLRVIRERAKDSAFDAFKKGPGRPKRDPMSSRASSNSNAPTRRCASSPSRTPCCGGKPTALDRAHPWAPSPRGGQALDRRGHHRSEDRRDAHRRACEILMIDARGVCRWIAGRAPASLADDDLRDASPVAKVCPHKLTETERKASTTPFMYVVLPTSYFPVVFDLARTWICRIVACNALRSHCEVRCRLGRQRPQATTRRTSNPLLGLAICLRSLTLSMGMIWDHVQGNIIAIAAPENEESSRLSIGHRTLRPLPSTHGHPLSSTVTASAKVLNEDECYEPSTRHTDRSVSSSMSCQSWSVSGKKTYSSGPA